MALVSYHQCDACKHAVRKQDLKQVHVPSKNTCKHICDECMEKVMQVINPNHAALAKENIRVLAMRKH